MLRLVNEEGGKGEGRETSWEDTAVIQETDETYLGQDGAVEVVNDGYILMVQLKGFSH